MKTTNNTRKSKFLALLLSVMMLSSAGAVFASCDNGDDSSSSTSSSTDSSTTDSTPQKKDEGLIKNSNFDFTSLSDTVVIGTPSNWNVYSTDAATHSKTSGVIDVSEDGWKYLTGRSDVNLDAYKTATEIPEDVWKTMTAKDKLAFYKLWKESNKSSTISKDFKNYESLNVTNEDKLPAVDAKNPGRHSDDIKDSEGNQDYNMLMIHNATSTSKIVGTAKRYTSSSTVSIPAGSSAEVSVWVKTTDLMMSDSEGTAIPAIGKGAYISLSNSVGGTSLDAYEVKNVKYNGKVSEI